MGLSFSLAAGPRQGILRSESRGIHDHILLSHIRDSLNLEGQVLYIPQEQGGPVTPQGTDTFRSLSTDRIEITASNSSSIVTWARSLPMALVLLRV
jgi:hypothetical protein